MTSATETNAPTVGAEQATEPVKVSMSKLVEGVSTVFMGVVQMLGALDPSTATTVAIKGIEAAAANAEAKAEGHGAVDAHKEEANETKDTIPGTAVLHDDAAPADEAVAEPPKVTAQEEIAKPVPRQEFGITLDDITKIIVAKIKQDKGNNEKIKALVTAHGAQRVRDLSPEKYEAFLTDLSQL